MQLLLYQGEHTVRILDITSILQPFVCVCRCVRL